MLGNFGGLSAQHVVLQATVLIAIQRHIPHTKSVKPRAHRHLPLFRNDRCVEQPMQQKARKMKLSCHPHNGDTGQNSNIATHLHQIGKRFICSLRRSKAQMNQVAKRKKLFEIAVKFALCNAAAATSLRKTTKAKIRGNRHCKRADCHSKTRTNDPHT